jgi:glycosyltransferase involved in cell wall biosynthesis
MQPPLISIVMPSFNQADYIEEAICSIIDQDYPNLEFMVFDGGSTDGSREIIEKYAPRLAFWRSGPDRGQSDAIAQGFARAQGDLLGWVNSDDALLPGALNRIARAYRENPAGGIFGGNYILMDEAGRIIRCKRHPANAGWFARRGIFAFNPPGSFFRNQDYWAVKGLRIELHYVMDTDLYIRMVSNGARYVHVDRYLSFFRKHRDQKTTALLEDALREEKKMQEELWPAPLRRYARQKRWGVLFRLWQVINGNYLRMQLDTLKLKGTHWQTLPLQPG